MRDIFLPWVERDRHYQAQKGLEGWIEAISVHPLVHHPALATLSFR